LGEPVAADSFWNVDSTLIVKDMLQSTNAKAQIMGLDIKDVNKKMTRRSQFIDQEFEKLQPSTKKPRSIPSSDDEDPEQSV